jgi:hypothetical protein
MSKDIKAQRGIQLVPVLDPVQISFDLEAFDNAIFSYGTKLVHYRAMRCPIGVTDRNDIHHSQADHDGCSNGFMYT